LSIDGIQEAEKIEEDKYEEQIKEAEKKDYEASFPSS